MDGGRPAQNAEQDSERVGPWKNFKNPYQDTYNPHLPQKNLVSLTHEELRVLQECNRESFWYRSLPASMLCIGITQLAVNKGYLKPHPKFGASLKSLAAGLAGYIIGKLSYQNECRKKILALPNSQLAETLRRRSSGGSPPSEFEFEKPQDTVLATNDPKIFEESNVFEIKPEHRQPQGAPNQDYKSYEDLRRQNRQSYSDKQSSRWTRPTGAPSQQPIAPPEYRPGQDVIQPSRETHVSSKNLGKSKNQYGDLWEEE
ncbi:OCIA domain-containing protein 1-like [Argonauta hians]